MKKTLIMFTLSVSCLSLMAMSSDEEMDSDDEGYRSDTNVARPMPIQNQPTQRLYDVIYPGHPNMPEARMADFENRARQIAREEAFSSPRLSEPSIQVLLFDSVNTHQNIIHRADGSTITLAELIRRSRD